ncbi:hypothetical protein Sjap_017179 [Stephania japonica]|uniref:Uncharacterized protein n=1 Tax=Stephania japonica TaxID=461633 RepID=A0AAP0NJK9_9MAGN
MLPYRRRLAIAILTPSPSPPLIHLTTMNHLFDSPDDQHQKLIEKLQIFKNMIEGWCWPGG